MSLLLLLEVDVVTINCGCVLLIILLDLEADVVCSKEEPETEKAATCVVHTTEIQK
jgi:hypothetical protein